MANPTGEVTNETVLEVAKKYSDNAEAILLIGRILDRMFPTGIEQAIEMSDGGTPLAPGDPPGVLVDAPLGAELAAAEGIDLEGTSVFVKLACWGPEVLEPDLSFKQGYIRVDSPGLSEEVVNSLETTGDFLLTFGLCVFPTGTIIGKNPAFYEKDGETLLGTVGFELNSTVYNDGKVTDFLDERVVIRNGVFSILYRLDDATGTLRVDASVDYATFVITGKNGAFACTAATGEPECVVTS
jgi:hypothetical protein